MFLIVNAMKIGIFFGNERGMSGDLCKNIFLKDLFGIQYFFELHYTSLPDKDSENVVKSRCFEKFLLRRAQISF